MNKEIFNGMPTSPIFSRRQLGAEVTDGIRSGEIALGELEQLKLHRINQILNHPELDHLIDEGKITLFIIKPQVNISRGLSSDDQESADMLMDEIGRENIVFSFSTKLKGLDVDEFYKDAKKLFTEEWHKDPPEGQRIWQSVYEYSQSGALTFGLYYDEKGNAVKTLMDKVGITHPRDADPESIRGKHGIEEELPKNLVHRSDTPKAVKNELGVFKRLFIRLEQRSCQNKKSMPSEDQVRDSLDISDDLEILAIKRVITGRAESGITEKCLDALIYEPRDLVSGLHSKTPEPLSA